ncbi:hypothetical protein ADH76_11630 [Enterocloster clostridioformis]|nr:hypothetical protein A4V08_22980 [Lachnoclostridium sp. YL32]OXE69054.1 hypothetical protein ADH76_11630 [Enterocloster clostridioformis]QQR02876.1 DUF4280 domain-containing protein [Enterocloster clostridioformis]
MQKSMINSYKDYSAEEYSKISMELIWKQQQYMPSTIEKYVARGSILSCVKGSNKSKIDMLQDKGVYDNGNPVFTLHDCIEGENIHSFCTCQLCHETFGNCCVPQPVGKWLQTNSNVYAFSKQEGEYIEILKDSAALPCVRGGYIIIEETPVPLVADTSEKACYETHRVEFQYNEKSIKAIFNYTQDQLSHFVECMDNNLIIYNSKSKKYVFDMKKFNKNRKWNDPKVDSNSLVKLYTLFKAEIIMRKYDLIMEKHYKNWLIYGKTEDVTATLTSLFKENTQLLIDTRTKFMSVNDVSKKKKEIFTDKFFYDLVQTYYVWDIKNRVTVMNFLVDNNELTSIKNRLGVDVFNEAQNGTLVYDDKTNRYKFTFRVEPYGKKYYIFKGEQRSRDYYGNYNFGYVGAAFYYYRLGEDALNKLLNGSDLAQRSSNFPKVWVGDPEEDKIAIKDGYNDYMGIVE